MKITDLLVALDTVWDTPPSGMCFDKLKPTYISRRSVYLFVTQKFQPNVSMVPCQNVGKPLIYSNWVGVLKPCWSGT